MRIAVYPLMLLVVKHAEFKVQSSQENAQTALQQIRDKHYDAPYRSAGKPIILLGIAFDPAGRTISDWAVE